MENLKDFLINYYMQTLTGKTTNIKHLPVYKNRYWDEEKPNVVFLPDISIQQIPGSYQFFTNENVLN